MFGVVLDAASPGLGEADARPFALTDRLLTTREVAELLGLSTETVLRRHRAGEIPGYRLASNCLRFRETEIEAYLASVRTEVYSAERE